MILLKEIQVKYNNLGVPDTVYKGVIRQTDNFVTRLKIDLTDVPGDILTAGINVKKEDGTTNTEGLIVTYPIPGQPKKFYVDISNWFTNIPGTLEITVQALASMNGLTQVFNCSKITFCIEGTAIELDPTVVPEFFNVLSVNGYAGVIDITHENIGEEPDAEVAVPDEENNTNFKFRTFKAGPHIVITQYDDHIEISLADDIPTNDAVDGALSALSEVLTEALNTHADNNNAHNLASLRSTVSGLVTAVGNLQTVVGSGGADADVIINKLAEVYEFLADFEENDDLLAMINSKLDEVVVEGGEEETGKYVSAVKRDETDKNKIVVEKKDLPQEFSGDYNDLSNKPNIPYKTSDLTNDSGFITEEDLPVPYDDSELWNEIDDINDNKIPGLIKNFQLLSNGVFRVTKYDNTYFDIDTNLEKVVTNFTYNATTKNLELSLDDSTVLTIPMSAFIDDYSGSEGTQFVINVSSENVISVTMKDGTVTYNQLAQAVKDKLDSIENKVDLYWCTYETTTYADITTAINNGKLPVVKYLDRIYRLTCAEGNFQIGLTHHHFEAVIGEISYYVRVSNLNTWHADDYTLAKSSELPTKVSDLENDSGFITASDIPTVPTISTSIPTDASSDTKTTSPKAVKDYVDTVVGDIETLLEGI